MPSFLLIVAYFFITLAGQHTGAPLYREATALPDIPGSIKQVLAKN